MKLIEQFITKNDCFQNNQNKADGRYTTFQNRGPIGLMLHSVGTPQPSAKVFADTWNVSGKEVAVHAVVQADGTVYQCMPWNYRGWHAGGSANDTHIGVEMTEPSQIRYTGGASFTCSDLAAAQAQAKGCYQTAVTLFAKLCQTYGLHPKTAILSHAEGYSRGIASAHADPEHLWKGLNLPYTMDTFRTDVEALLTPTPLYRIRTSASDASGQIGAYQSLEKAINACVPGYGVYDAQGNRVFYNPGTLEGDTDMMNMEQILETLGDRYIRNFDDLPEWAKPEMRQMLDLGLINGGTQDDPNDINMLLSDIRIIMIAYRMLQFLKDS